MRHKRLKLTGLILLGFGLTGLQAQTMYVRDNSGTQTAYNLSSVQKMTFSEGIVTIQKADNSIDDFSLSDLRYLNFIDLTTGISEPTIIIGNSKLLAYPNPFSDVLNIDLTEVKGEGIISILTLEGKVVQTQKVSGNSSATINLSNIPRGFYICRYSNASTILTVKIIKL